MVRVTWPLSMILLSFFAPSKSERTCPDVALDGDCTRDEVYTMDFRSGFMVCRPTDCQVKYGGDTDAIFTFDNACRLCFEETSSNCNLCPAVSDGKYLGCFECHNGTNAQQLDLHENNDGVGVTPRDVVFLLAVCVIAIAICACICKCSTLCGIHWRSASCIRRSVAQADMHSNARPRANSDNVDAFSRGAFLAPSGKSYLDRHSFMRAAAQVERDHSIFPENAHSFIRFIHPTGSA